MGNGEMGEMEMGNVEMGSGNGDKYIILSIFIV
jgi:hypothetical protein